MQVHIKGRIMGIKFLASTTIGSKPTTADIGEREIAFNLADGKIYTSNGTTIIPLGVDAAGVGFNASSTYPAGSMVSNNGIAYINTTPVVTAGPFDPTAWKPIGLKEAGGLIYDPTTNYNTGDIVSDGGKLYVSKTTGNLNNTPSSTPTAWQDTTSSLTYVNSFGPNAGLEYPATPTANSYYRVDGLATPYVMTGGDLVGSTLSNGDEIIFDGITWTSRPGPTIPAEHGGIAWTSADSYKSGDIVSYSHEIFLALKDSNGVQPDTSITDWEKFGHSERGGVAWQPNFEYKGGDAITEVGVMYVALADHTSGATFTADAAKWSDAFIVSNLDPGLYV